MIGKIKHWLRKNKLKSNKPVIIPRKKHPISRKQISKHAVKVLYRLHNSGFQAYLVGGGVRDLLIDSKPKDFDIVTNAHPPQVKKLFKNSLLIGRRFRLAHVRFGREIIEVATFRTGKATFSEQGMILRDNEYGTIDGDVLRRDFTINALYYNIADFTIVDFVGGIKDIEQKQIKLIGDPSTRYTEDPVRMLRAIRFAIKLEFNIHIDTAEPISRLKNLLSQVPAARLYEEYLKLFLTGKAYNTFYALKKYALLEKIFPQVRNSKLIDLALKNTDQRISDNKSISPAFLIAVFLWENFYTKAESLISTGIKIPDAFAKSEELILTTQLQSISIPRRFSHMIREIWKMQLSLNNHNTRRAYSLFTHPRFRAAYDLLLLRAEAGEKKAIPLAKWWTNYITRKNAK